MKELTPIEEALYQLDETIKQLQLQRDALAAHIPIQDKDRKKGPVEFIHPVTGEKRIIKPSKGCRRA